MANINIKNIGLFYSLAVEKENKVEFLHENQLEHLFFSFEMILKVFIL